MFDVDHRCRRGTGGGGALQRASARKHLPSSVRGLEARLEVSWFVVADGGSRSAWPGWRRWCAPCPLTCPRKSQRPRLDRPSRLGREPLRTQPGRLRPGDDGRGCGARSHGPLRSSGLRRPGARRTPRRADWTVWGLDEGPGSRAGAPPPPPRPAFLLFFLRFRDFAARVTRLCLQLSSTVTCLL